MLLSFHQQHTAISLPCCPCPPTTSRSDLLEAGHKHRHSSHEQLDPDAVHLHPGGRERESKLVMAMHCVI